MGIHLKALAPPADSLTSTKKRSLEQSEYTPVTVTTHSGKCFWLSSYTPESDGSERRKPHWRISLM